MCGTPSNIKKIHELSLIYGFKIIEDASHAIGAQYHGTNIGDCRYSDISVFSLHPVKIITTGEGGIVTTKNKEIASILKYQINFLWVICCLILLSKSNLFTIKRVISIKNHVKMQAIITTKIIIKLII